MVNYNNEYFDKVLQNAALVEDLAFEAEIYQTALVFIERLYYLSDKHGLDEIKILSDYDNGPLAVISDNEHEKIFVEDVFYVKSPAVVKALFDFLGKSIIVKDDVVETVIIVSELVNRSNSAKIGLESLKIRLADSVSKLTDYR